MFFHGTNLPLPVGTILSYKNGPAKKPFQTRRGAIYFTTSNYQVPKGEPDGTVNLDEMEENTPDSKTLRAISSALTYAVRSVYIRGVHPSSQSMTYGKWGIIGEESGLEQEEFTFDTEEDYQRVLRNHQKLNLDTTYLLNDEKWNALTPEQQDQLNETWPQPQAQPMRGYWVYQIKPCGPIFEDQGQHWSDRYTTGHLEIVDIIVHDGVFINKKHRPLTHRFIIPEMNSIDRKAIRELRHP